MTERIHEQVHTSDPAFEAKRTIVIPIDGSPSTDYTLQFAIDSIIEKAKDQIILLHTRQPLYSEMRVELGYPYILANGDIEKAEQGLRDSSHELLRSHAKKLLDLGIHVRAISLQGDAREELTHKINSLGCDLVIMGSRGLNKISQVLLGSVSNYLVHHVSAPVMVVPLKK